MNDEARHELEVIRNENGGRILPALVVEYARDPSTALHAYFEWDDSTAAERYRLAQARALIRVAVVVEPTTSERVRAYVSLSTDRKNEGGYRALAEILSDEVAKDTLLQDALKELASFKRKYESLKTVSELGGLFSSIEETVRMYSRPAQDQEARPAA